MLIKISILFPNKYVKAFVCHSWIYCQSSTVLNSNLVPVKHSQNFFTQLGLDREGIWHNKTWAVDTVSHNDLSLVQCQAIIFTIPDILLIAYSKNIWINYTDIGILFSFKKHHKNIVCYMSDSLFRPPHNAIRVIEWVETRQIHRKWIHIWFSCNIL